MNQHTLRTGGWEKRLRAALSPRRSKRAFLEELPKGARVLDVGCGNNAPAFAKSVRPDLHYTGLDVIDLGHYCDPRSIADEYILASPAEFAAAIGTLGSAFDAVISTHNLEHCNDPPAVLSAMMAKLSPAGRLLLTFPCEASVAFPSRRGSCLNFWDDPTHKEVPCFNSVMTALLAENFRIIFSSRRYRPLIKAAVGVLTEPVSRLRGVVMSGTWELYGFESVIWAEKSPVAETPSSQRVREERPERRKQLAIEGVRPSAPAAGAPG